MSIELKRCPFCSGEAQLKKGFCQLDNYVECLKCGSRTAFYNTEKTAVKTWNTRKPIDKVVEQLEFEKSVAFMTLANTGNEDCDFAYDNVMRYMNTAIKIAKGGGSDD